MFHSPKIYFKYIYKFTIHKDTQLVITTAVDGIINCKKQKPAERENIKQIYNRL